MSGYIESQADQRERDRAAYPVLHGEHSGETEVEVMPPPKTSDDFPRGSAEWCAAKDQEVADAIQQMHARDELYRELTKMSGYVTKMALDFLLTNPMVAPMMGPQYTEDGSKMSERIGEILAQIDPENYQG